jgi:hypothetical protein
VDPKMKFESRTVSTWLGAGYTTRRFSGPSTVGMGGSEGAVTGTSVVAGLAGPPAGAAAGGTGPAAGGGASTGPGAREQAARTTSAVARQSGASRMRENYSGGVRLAATRTPIYIRPAQDKMTIPRRIAGCYRR